MKKNTGTFSAMTVKTQIYAHTTMFTLTTCDIRLAGDIVELTLLYLPLFYLAMSAITDLVI